MSSSEIPANSTPDGVTPPSLEHNLDHLRGYAFVAAQQSSERRDLLGKVEGAYQTLVGLVGQLATTTTGDYAIPEQTLTSVVHAQRRSQEMLDPDKEQPADKTRGAVESARDAVDGTQKALDHIGEAAKELGEYLKPVELTILALGKRNNDAARGAQDLRMATIIAKKAASEYFAPPADGQSV
jgi:hypothetical protein